jgi:hypothetical protein
VYKHEQTKLARISGEQFMKGRVRKKKKKKKEKRKTGRRE